MPRSLSYRGAGNINLRGKKTKMLDCRCCDVVDFRDDYETKRVASEELNVSLDDALSEQFDSDLPVKYFDKQDRGEWTLFTDCNGKIGVASSDFKHDVVLYVNGDFANDADRREYASLIAARLNRTIPYN